jgi:two-component system, OmpR family, sensor kinase
MKDELSEENRRLSMTRRLVTALTCLVVLFWLIAVGIGAYVMNREFAEIFDSSLQETAERLMPLILDDLSQRHSEDGPQDLQAAIQSISREYLTYQVLDAGGKIVLRSLKAPETAYEVPLAVGFHNTKKYRIYTVSAIKGTLFLHVADAFRNRREALREGTIGLLWPLLVLVPASVFLVRLIVRRFLAPIDRLRGEIASKDSGNLAPINSDAMPRELLPIARSVNLLLGRLRSAIEAEREFTSNSAHELRTPVAGALAQTQRLKAELPPGPLYERAGKIETSLSNLGRLAEKLLQLARAESGIAASNKTSDLTEIIDALVADYDRDEQTAGRIERHYKGAFLKRMVDIDAFAILMRNLIENALLHGAADHPIVISLEGHDTICVVNGGDVVPPEELDGLKRRFRRSRMRASGSGLGLAIAERIVTQIGGRLDLLSPASGRSDGFEARVTLPEQAATAKKE